MTGKKLIIDEEKESLDDLIVGGMKLIQARSGYRFSIDAVLLAHFVDLSRVKRVVDLGTGNGVIPLLTAGREENCELTGVEFQEDMVKRARRNVSMNGLDERVKIVHADIKRIEDCLTGGYADLVLSNPPFWRKGEGRISSNKEEALARHEIEVDLGDIVAKADYLLRQGGRLAIIQRADRLEEMMMLFKQNKFCLKRMRMIHSRIDHPAKLVLLEGQKNGHGKLDILPPMVIYQQNGEYCEELQKIYSR